MYGHPFEGEYVVDANWQLGFTAATLAGKPFLPQKVTNLVGIIIVLTRHFNRIGDWRCHYWPGCKAMGPTSLRVRRVQAQHRWRFCSNFRQYTCGLLLWQVDEWNRAWLLHYRCTNVCLRGWPSFPQRRSGSWNELRHSSWAAHQIWCIAPGDSYLR